MMIQQITQRLSEVNTLVATCHQDGFSFGRALSLSLFYRDFNDTNSLVKEAENLARENPARLLECSISLLSETDGYLSSDRSELYAAGSEKCGHPTLARLFGKKQPSGFTAAGVRGIQAA